MSPTSGNFSNSTPCATTFSVIHTCVLWDYFYLTWEAFITHTTK